MNRIVPIVTIIMLVTLISCDSMMDDKSRASQNDSLLLLLNPNGGNPESQYAISGRVYADGGEGVTGINVAITDGTDVNLTAVTDGSGDYSIKLPSAGNYTVTPSGDGYAIDPPSRVLLVEGRAADVDFSASIIIGPPESENRISGRVTNGGYGVAGISITISGGEGVNLSAVTDDTGRYSAGLGAPGSYTVTPVGGAYHIYPESRGVSVQGSVAEIDFSAGTPLWSRTYGTSLNEAASSACRTSDGGYVIAGYGYSAASGIVSIDGRVLKIDAGGNVIWDRYFSGTGEEKLLSIVETADHNYAAAGYTTSKGNGGKDAWIIMIDPNGALIPGWDLTFGGAEDDIANSIIQSSTGGYVFTGVTRTTANKDDAYAVGIDADGGTVFEKSFGGEEDDGGKVIMEAGPGAYLIAGYNKSHGSGDMDSWVFKIDGFGAIMKTADELQDWNFYYGKTGNDSFTSVIQDGCGGYLLGGYSTSPSNELRDFRIVRIGSGGTVAWDYDERYSGDGDEVINSLRAAADGGFIAAGRVSQDITYGDLMILKIDADGNKLWQKTYGGPDDDSALSIISGYDGTFLIAGYMTDYLKKTKDFWILNVDGNGEYSR